MPFHVARTTVLLVFLGLLCSPAHAGHPARGDAKWSFLLCNYLDSPATPAQSRTDMEAMLLQRGTGGLADFYADVSRGAMGLSGSVVRGFFTIPMTTTQVRAFSHGGAGGDRGRSFQLCVDAARAGGYTPPADHNVAVITSPEVDLWGGGGGRAFLAVGKELAAYGHEVSHGFGMQHSHSDNVTAPCGGALTEYHDNFDQMSWACWTQGILTASYGVGGPAFNAFHLDRMGWLGRHEIVVFGADGTTSATVTLTALYRSGFGGTRLVRIPFDPADLSRYFTVELRMATGWDAGFGSPIVLIHESQKVPSGEYRSFLQRSSPDGPAAQTLARDGVTITVQSVDPATGTAQVAITSELPSRCMMGFVWREAGPNDRACVTGQARQLARNENANAASRRSPNGGAYGPDTCKQGFVWREAFAGDHACVDGAARQRVRAENAAAAGHTNPARLAYGPNTCKSGLVWREADDRDWVCVTGATRTETASENALAASRRVGLTNTCKQGYVWREAYGLDDKTCVPGSSRTRARADNAAADSNRIAF